MKPDIVALPAEPDAADDEALAHAAHNDRAAFTPLYHRYAFSRVGNAQEAEDITAQVFVDALVALSNYHARGQFAGWLFTLAYRRCADYHRRPKPEPLAETLAAPVDDPAGQMIHRETFARLETLLGELNGDALEMLRLHYAAVPPTVSTANPLSLDHVIETADGYIFSGQFRQVLPASVIDAPVEILDANGSLLGYTLPADIPLSNDITDTIHWAYQVRQKDIAWPVTLRFSAVQVSCVDSGSSFILDVGSDPQLGQT